MAEKSPSTEGSTFREGWVTVNQVPTHVITWGTWIEDPIENDSIMVCITGTPGVPDFYITFLSKLYELIKMPIWIINYAGQFIFGFRLLLHFNFFSFDQPKT
jgi:hypothetical protein